MALFHPIALEYFVGHLAGSCSSSRTHLLHRHGLALLLPTEAAERWRRDGLAVQRWYLTAACELSSHSCTTALKSQQGWLLCFCFVFCFVCFFIKCVCLEAGARLPSCVFGSMRVGYKRVAARTSYSLPRLTALSDEVSSFAQMSKR